MGAMGDVAPVQETSASLSIVLTGAGTGAQRCACSFRSGGTRTFSLLPSEITILELGSEMGCVQAEVEAVGAVRLR